MPIYEFHCDKCKCDFEELTSADSQPPQCPHCGSSSTSKLMSACARHRGGARETAPASGGGGCAGCSGGNCASCGH